MGNNRLIVLCFFLSLQHIFALGNVEPITEAQDSSLAPTTPGLMNEPQPGSIPNDTSSSTSAQSASAPPAEVVSPVASGPAAEQQPDPLNTPPIASANLLTFFFEPISKKNMLPDSTDITPEQRAHFTQFLTTPAKINHAILHGHSSLLVAGIYVLYMGLLTHSDVNGEVLFPRKQSDDTILMVITNGIVPVFLSGATIHHHEVRETADAAFYTFTRNYTKKTDKHTWLVTKIAPPTKKRIPDNAVVIIAKPEQIDIIEGELETGDSANFVLPDVYVTTEITTPINVLSILKYNKFFAPVYKSFAYAPGRYATMLANTL